MERKKKNLVSKKKEMNVLFARKITKPQLSEYVECFAETCEIVWVDIYTSVYCLPHIDSETKHVYFMQIGPFKEFAQQLADKNITMHLVNTEQMTRLKSSEEDKDEKEEEEEEVPFPFQDYVLKYLYGPNPICATVIDYSATNLAILKSHISACVKQKLKCFKPLRVPVYKIEDKRKNVVFVGDDSSKRRQKVLAQIPTVLVLQRVYGRQRDDIIYSHKILVNIHYGSSYTVFEELRCLPCVLAKTIVISEMSHVDKAHPLFPFILFVPYDQLANMVQTVLANYDDFFTKLFVVQDQKFATLLTDIQTYEDSVNQTYQ